MGRTALAELTAIAFPGRGAARAAAKRCPADPGSRFAFNRGPGSAAQHCMLRSARDTHGTCRTFASSTNPLIKQPCLRSSSYGATSTAPPPVLFGRRRVRPLPPFRLRPCGLRRDEPPPSNEDRGRAGRVRVRAHSSLRKVRKLKVLRPTGLDASRRRGLSKSGPSSLSLRRASRKSASPLASRARCLLGLLRIAPGGLTVSGDPPLFGLEGRLSTAVGPKRCPALPTVPAAVASGAAVTRGKRAGTHAAWTAGSGKPAPHLRRPRTGHRSPPRVWRR